MSWSSGASSAPGYAAASGRRRGHEGRSPVRYRESPMAYWPDKLCRCNRKAPRWISWSRQNPGRRYYACVNALNGNGCGYAEWCDEALPKFLSDLVGDLRDEVWRLRGEANVARQPEEEALPEEEPAMQTTVQALQDQLKKKSEEIAVLKGNFEKVVFVLVVFVFGVVAGKLFQ